MCKGVFVCVYVLLFFFLWALLPEIKRMIDWLIDWLIEWDMNVDEQCNHNFGCQTQLFPNLTEEREYERLF